MPGQGNFASRPDVVACSGRVRLLLHALRRSGPVSSGAKYNGGHHGFVPLRRFFAFLWIEGFASTPRREYACLLLLVTPFQEPDLRSGPSLPTGYTDVLREYTSVTV